MDLRKQKNPRVRIGIMMRSNLVKADWCHSMVPLEPVDTSTLTSASPWPPPPSSSQCAIQGPPHPRQDRGIGRDSRI